MTKLPERIWAAWTENFGAVQIGTWADSIRFERLGSEYIRADLAQAQVAAALREQISRASEWASETFDGDPVSIADWLEAHIPPDAQAALDRVIAQAVAEERARCVAVCAEFMVKARKRADANPDDDEAQAFACACNSIHYALKKTKPSAPQPLTDTWHERRTMLPDGDMRKEKPE
jgi:hypothetical protein